MKIFAMMVLWAALAGCGTVGGAVSGAGSDLSKVGEWIKQR